MKKMKRIRTEDDYEIRWILVGPLGAIDFHCSTLAWTEEMRATVPGMWRSGGVEYHYRAAPYYMRTEGPSHERCWILGGPCWHDGTSLWASEHWIPLLERSGEDAIWQELQKTYVDHDWPNPEAEPVAVPADASEAPHP
jgi:hypothetical protein